MTIRARRFSKRNSEIAFAIRLCPYPVSLIRVPLFLCRANEKGVQLPGYHFVDHCIEILSHDKDHNKVKLYEHAVAHSGLPDNKRQ